jgi:hypothetical protein
LVVLLLAVSGFSVVAYAASVKEVQEHARAMSRDAEDMVAHGGMGDAKAIVYHCQEVVKHAEAILKGAPAADPHTKEATVHLEEAIRQCQRVAKFGDHVDPGVTLNPGTKARAAVREAVKHLSLIKDEGAY